MYTIEDITSTFEELEANKGHLIHADIMEAITEDEHTLGILRQLLDTMRALEAKQARIKAARETIEREFDAAIVSGDEDFHRGWLAGYLKALTSIEGDSE